MPSPFPGMDPYIESTGAWPTFHQALITALHDQLNERLPPNYLATMDERVRLVSLSEELAWGGKPDVSVVRDPPAGAVAIPRSGGAAASATIELEPAAVTLPSDYIEARESFIQIIQFPERNLVTTIEVLSPANKHEPHRGEYLAKRRALLRGGVSLVEIDLLLLGRHPEPEDALPPGDYYALVTRAHQLPTCHAYAWGVRRKLPAIPVPLRPGEPEATLDLAASFAATYRRGRYERLLRYAGPPPGGLAEADARWAAEVARGAAAG